MMNREARAAPPARGRLLVKRHLPFALGCAWIVAFAGISRPDEPRADANRAGPDWWSLQPVRRPIVPKVRDAGLVRNSIDAFVLARLESRSLRLAAPADRAVLLRRVTFDLHGLPPTPEEIDAFVVDSRPDAWERVIDRLLTSPHYGERWGRHWLDVARFSESHGFEYDKARDNAWHYRDYVIKSLNDDKPYPLFVREQLAGDVLPPITADGIAATGFLVCSPWDEAGNGSASALLKARTREEEMEDMLAAVGQTFLGLTLNCARCHDHKFDPIEQADYYRFKDAFTGVRPGNRSLLTPAEQRSRDAALAAVSTEINKLNNQIAEIDRAGRVALAEKGERSSGPVPLSRWTFQIDARDSIGSLHGTVHGGAKIANGRLVLNGHGAFLETAALGQPLREKTLEAWCIPAPVTQRGGGVLSIEAKGGSVFDAIVFGERDPGKWMAGSEFFRRTRDPGGVVESARAGELVHVAIAYGADNRITVYRNGQPYGEGYQPDGDAASLRTYSPGEAHVLIGLRHTGGGNAYFAGEVADARLYDRALSAAEVAASFRAGPDGVSAEVIRNALTSEQRVERARLMAELSRLRADQAKKSAPPPQTYAAMPGAVEATYVLRRGDVEKRSERVSAAGLSALAKPSPDLGLSANALEGERRLKLADWIVSADNPLTARVLVNRVWHYHFGRGLVGTPSDFGFNGEQPSHPELLDWLASEFVAKGWSIKALHKTILLSATYQQGSAYDEKAAALDGDCRLLWRFPPRRLEGEAVRDAMLAVSGKLNPAVGGPSFRPFTVKIFNSHFYTLTDRDEPEFNRRAVYRINVCSAKDPLLESLDCPDPATKAPRRGVTVTPIQALGLMNNSFVLRQARYLAERVTKEAGSGLPSRVNRAYQLALARTPTATEADRAKELASTHGLESLCWALLNSSEFLNVR
jgi:hypothetical protein